MNRLEEQKVSRLDHAIGGDRAEQIEAALLEGDGFMEEIQATANHLVEVVETGPSIDSLVGLGCPCLGEILSWVAQPRWALRVAVLIAISLRYTALRLRELESVRHCAGGGDTHE